MPNWGLTDAQRKSSPWGIPEELLAPCKVITDPVHGDIYITVLEAAILDTEPMQRLRRVRQLGMTHLVYPGATQTRFSHALGTLRAAQDLLDVVVNQRNSMRPTKEEDARSLDLFAQWLTEDEATPQKNFDKQVAEATVLTRMGALLHDLGHISFGHSIEDELGILDAHDKNKARFRRLWTRMLNDLSPKARAGFSREFKAALRPLILSKEEKAKGKPVTLPEPATKYPFVADIVGNTICADLLDYLRRDHLFTGLPAQFGTRFLQGFYVSPKDHQYHRGRMVIRIAKDGRPRADVISELFKFLRYRYELSERALTHHAKLAADAMVGKLLEMWRDHLWIAEAVRRLDPKPNPEPIDKDEAKKLVDPTGQINKLTTEIDKAVADQLEKEFLRLGDDGLLERLRDNYRAGQTKLERGIHTLSSDLLKRALFKQIGSCSSARASARHIYEGHRKPDDRKDLERKAAKFAGLSDGWKVVLWIPPPEMRMKAADVLVDDGHMIAPLKEYDKAHGNHGAEIYSSHEALWAVSLYVHPEVLAGKDSITREVILAYVGERLGIAWDERPKRPSLVSLAVHQVALEDDISPEAERELLATAEQTTIAAKGGTPALTNPMGHTFERLKLEVRLLRPPPPEIAASEL